CGDSGIGYWRLSSSIHHFWRCIRGLYPLGCGVCFGRRGRVLSR
ncbi:unnamed protein product, partial [Tuber aestivum]